MVARSSAELEFRALVLKISEGSWVTRVLMELKLMPLRVIKVNCDNKFDVKILNNLVQHDKTKYIEINRQFYKEKIDKKIIDPKYVCSTN